MCGRSHPRRVPSMGGVTTSPLLARPGAVPDLGTDAGVAWHYGDPFGEQRAADTTSGLIDLSHRVILAVRGEDRLNWLHTVTSQQLVDAPVGTVTEALVLSPRGHVEHHMAVTVRPEEVWLETDASAASALQDYLTSMVFWSRVSIEAIDTTARLRLVGPEVGELTSTFSPMPEPGRLADTEWGGVARTVHGVDLLVDRAELGRVASELINAGARPVGSWAATARRLIDRRPRLGLDTDDRTIPNELPWLDTAVHLAKGCYRGQETVARVHNLGRPPRRLALLHLDGSADRLPEPGDELVSAQGRVVGRVGSAAQHYEDGPIALALVKRSVPADAALLAGGIDAALDPDDADPQADPPVSVIDRRAFPDLRR